MNRWITGLMLVGIISISAVPGYAQKGKKFRGGFGQDGWLNSYEAAKTQAKNTKKPIMMVIRCVP